MPEATFKRPGHRQVHTLLSCLNATFLTETRCYFGGGTRIVVELGEYRESRDVDLLCSDRDGYRRLRETVSETSLGAVAASGVSLSRQIRADQYGIRTFIDIGGAKLKFEIVREARIDIEGQNVQGIPVTCLSRRHCFAEKFLANADRGMDASTLSRDIIDLAYMVNYWPQEDAEAGLALATTAYGDAILRSLGTVTKKLRGDKTYRKRCINNLAVSDVKVLDKGLRQLAAISG